MESPSLTEQNRTYHEAQSKMELLPNYYRWTYGKFEEFLHGDVTELGCGAGMGISCYLENVRSVRAVDFNQELLNRVARTFDSDKIETIQADLTDAWDKLKGRYADVVILMDVLEHFREDTTFLKRAAELAKPGGVVVVKVPAQSRLYSEIDIASGHFRRYDVADLRKLAEQAGLSIVWIKEMNPLACLAYRLKKKNKKNFSKTFSLPQLRLINGLIPLLKYFDILKFLPGFSLVAALRKPES